MARKPKKPKTAWQSFLELLYMQPIYALPFALFFGTIHAAMAEVSETARAEEVVDHLFARVRAFLDGVEPGDDMTLMVLRVLDAPAARA